MFRDRLPEGRLGPKMVWVPGGSFQMGDIQGGGDSDEQPVHWVSVKRFAMGTHEVTVGEFRHIINYFKEQVHKAEGGNYQTLINNALHEYIEQQNRNQ